MSLFRWSLLFKGKPMYFGSVLIQKNYVSFHLFPVYTNPELGKEYFC